MWEGFLVIICLPARTYGCYDTVSPDLEALEVC